MSAEAGHGPLHQFEIHPLISMPQLGGYDIAFTNSALFMVLAVIVSTLIFLVGAGGKALVPGRMQCLAEMLYEFVANTIRDNAGKEGMKYAPFILTLFLFILFCNLLGLMPFSFTPTSHIIVTFAMAAITFIGITVIGFLKHGLHFLTLFVPNGVPAILIPFVCVIELFSYLVRPVSLSVRLAVNMMAGHTILKVVAGIVVMMGAFGVIPMFFLVCMIGFEIFVAIIQAYVFIVLTCIYLNDALHMH